MISDIELGFYLQKIREDLRKRFQIAEKMMEDFPDDKAVNTELVESSYRLLAFERLIILTENLIEKTMSLTEKILSQGSSDSSSSVDPKKNDVN